MHTRVPGPRGSQVSSEKGSNKPKGRKAKLQVKIKKHFTETHLAHNGVEGYFCTSHYSLCFPKTPLIDGHSGGLLKNRGPDAPDYCHPLTLGPLGKSKERWSQGKTCKANGIKTTLVENYH